MKRRKITALFMTTALAVSVLGGCGGGGSDSDAGKGSVANDSTETGGSAASSKGDGDVIEFTAFFAVPGAEKNDDNEIKEIIAEKTGAKVKETWLTGQTASEAVGTIVAGGEYPDIIDGGDAM